MSIEENDGGTVVTGDAATFELINKAAMVLYNDYPPWPVKNEDVIDSSKKNIVQYNHQSLYKTKQRVHHKHLPNYK